MNRRWSFIAALLLLSCSLPLAAQAVDEDTHSAGQLLLVLPFENKSTAPGLEWIGESFPEVLDQRMAQPALFVIEREDRVFALDRMGIPATTNPSRATIYTLAQAMDVDYVILGSYDYDGRTFSTQAQVLDMRNLRLTNPARESGQLTQLTEIQTSLAYDLLSEMQLRQLPPRNQFIARMPYVRLDSLENYVRGVLATSQPEKIHRYKEALRISPDYNFAKLALAHTYFDGRDYEQAANWFSRIPQNTPMALEANFFHGICEYYLGDYLKSQQAFQFVANRMPLTEVENNLGAALSHKNPRSAADYFRRAIDTDPRDADYRFNYALSLTQSGDTAEALHQTKEALQIKPGDTDARALLDALIHPAATQPTPVSSPQSTAAAATSAPSAVSRLQPRLKSNYDETTFREAELELRNVEELTLASKDPQKQAQIHFDRGNEMLSKGFYPEAEQEFRRALEADPRLAPAHVALARIALKNGDLTAASAELDSAIVIDPRNTDALDLKRDIAARPAPSSAAQKVTP